MSVVTISRMKVGQLNAILTQLGASASTATIAQVIASLQSKISDNLNTNCPTCQVDGTPTGFLESTTNGNTVYVPCRTCKGNILINTADGGVTPPTNPFSVTINTLLLPADFYQAKVSFDVEATELIVSLKPLLQANFKYVPANACPVCSGTGLFVNTVIGNAQVPCFLCLGTGKTVDQFTYTNGVVTKVPLTPPSPPAPPSLPLTT